MKKSLKRNNPDPISAEAPRITISEFLRRLNEIFHITERRMFSRREGADLVLALRSALASPNRLLVQDSLTQECYRYLSLVNRTPVSGLSLISCLGADLSRQIASATQLQTYASDYTDRLRSGDVKPDDEVPEYVQDLLFDYVELLQNSTHHFDVDIDELDASITSSSTYHTLKDFIFKLFDSNPYVPEPFIEAFVLAHCYLFRLSFLD